MPAKACANKLAPNDVALRGTDGAPPDTAAAAPVVAAEVGAACADKTRGRTADGPDDDFAPPWLANGLVNNALFMPYTVTLPPALPPNAPPPELLATVEGNAVRTGRLLLIGRYPMAGDMGVLAGLASDEAPATILAAAPELALSVLYG